MHINLTQYFANEQRRRELIYEARTWQGTPFQSHGRHKHVGVDCVQLAAALYYEAGLIDQVVFPSYSTGAGAHLTKSHVLEWLEDTKVFVPMQTLAVGFLQTGDLLGFNLERVVHHVGIYLEEGMFIHAIRPHGVLINSLYDPTYHKRWTNVWRPMEEA